MKPSIKMLCASLAMILVFAVPVIAADLSGTVTASINGTPVFDARVVLRGPGGLRQTTSTDAQGVYRFTGLDPSLRYTVDVEARGFNAFSQDVQMSSPSRSFDVILDLTTHHESVVVKESGQVISLESSAPVVAQVITPEAVAALPSAFRNVTKYAILDPHVRQSGSTGSEGAAGNRLVFNAESYRYTGYILDGVINYDWCYSNGPYQLVAASAVSDVKVITNQYAAEYGTSITGIVKVETKAGTNQLSGEAFVYVLPSGIQATPPVSTLHVPNQRIQGGAALGGPIITNKTYFFGNYEAVNVQRGAYIQSPVPLVYVGEGRETFGLARLDHNINDNHALALRLNIYHYAHTNANDRVSGFNQISYGRMERMQSTGGQLSYRLVYGTSLVNYFRVNYNKFQPDNNTPTGPYTPSVGISRPNYGTFGFSQFNWDRPRLLDLSDNVAWNHGRHNFKFGAEFVKIKVTDFLTNLFGTYTFPTGPPKAGEHPTQFQQIFGVANLRWSDSIWQAYFQDDFKISSRVSASVGVRYENQSTTDSVYRFGPRLGVAWDLFGTGKTRLTLGAGIFYSANTYNELKRALRSNENGPLFTYTIPWGVAGFPTFPNSLTAPPTSVQAARADIIYRPTPYLNPYSMKSAIGVEQELGGKWLLVGNGLWTHSLKGLRDMEMNAPSPFPRTGPGQVRTAAKADLTRPFIKYKGTPVRSLITFTNDNSTVYTALDLGLKRSVGRVHGEAHYVWAYQHTYGELDDWKANEWTEKGDPEGGPSNFYQRHRMVGHIISELPFGFSFSNILTAASGLPVNPITGVDNNGDSFKLDRPVGYNRNSFRMPRQLQWDMAVGKKFKLGERFGIEARTEFFNVINHNNFTTVNNIFGDAGVNGVPVPLSTFLAPIAGVGNVDQSRRIQFALKFLIGRQSRY